MRSWIKPALHTLLQDALITAQADLLREMRKINTELADIDMADNLVFYGIEEDNMSDNTEMAVKEVSEDHTIAKDPTDIHTGDLLQSPCCTYSARTLYNWFPQYPGYQTL